MQDYVCGFLFSLDRSKVLLIRKNRPTWQAGRLNGIGGKVEAGESIQEAIRREFREEAGLEIDQWEHVLTLSGLDWRGFFFRAFGELDRAWPVTDETLEIHPANALPEAAIRNLHWIVPLMLDEDVIGGTYGVELTAREVVGGLKDLRA